MMRLALSLGILAALVLAGCGGGSTSKKATKPAGPTKAEFIAQVNPLCASAKRRAPTAAINAAIGEFPTPTAKIARLLRKTRTVIDDLTRQLTAIPPPPADRAAVTRWISELAAIGKLVTRAEGQVSRNDLVGAVKSEQDIQGASIDPVAFAKDYGLSSCSSLAT
ncbi:MAG: hypothetical protein QOD61_1316 [Solirubrobacteraceae bacterium]|nr:hypothetical protein [Solirubrobacteraceae bacterium]